MAFTIKLQSPRYDNNGNGEEIQLPVSADTLQGSSLAEILTLFSGNNKILDFAQLREVVQLIGFLTPAAAVEAGYTNGAGDGIPVYHRDQIRRTRTAWPTEDGTLTGANWDTGTLPAAEQDAATTRGKGKVRLIYEKEWDTGAGDYANFFLYGAVADYRFGPRMAASGRTRIPYSLTFIVGSVSTAD